MISCTYKFITGLICSRSSIRQGLGEPRYKCSSHLNQQQRQKLLQVPSQGASSQSGANQLSRDLGNALNIDEDVSIVLLEGINHFCLVSGFSVSV